MQNAIGKDHVNIIRFLFNMKQISAAFVKAKKSFSPALKDKTNPHFKSKYADLGACIDAVEDALLANGIAMLQETFEDATGITVETVFLHESGEERRCGKLHVPAAKQDPQGYGSALTYARRYSLMAACGIAPEDDDGNAASKPSKLNGPRGVVAAVLDQTPSLDADTRKYIEVLAVEVADAFRAGGSAGAFDRVEVEALDNDQKVYLWSLLPSNIRSAIKSEKESRKTKG